MYIIYKPDIIIYDDERVASIKYKYTEKYFYATAELKSISIRYGWYIAVDADLFFWSVFVFVSYIPITPESKGPGPHISYA